MLFRSGDKYANYAAFIVDIVCFRKDASITIEQMDEIINGYHYPSDFADRLHKEVSALLK